MGHCRFVARAQTRKSREKMCTSHHIHRIDNWVNSSFDLPPPRHQFIYIYSHLLRAICFFLLNRRPEGGLYAMTQLFSSLLYTRNGNGNGNAAVSRWVIFNLVLKLLLAWPGDNEETHETWHASSLQLD